jgi:hypothetical protein
LYCTGAQAWLLLLRATAYSGTIPRMTLPAATAESFRNGLTEPLAELVAAWRLGAKPTAPNDSTPPLLARAFEQLFEVMQRGDAGPTGQQPAPGVDPAAITEAGEYALELFEQAQYWANHLDVPGVFTALQTYTIAMACWIAARGGELLTLEPVVDAFARQANTTQDPGELMALYAAMSDTLRATATVIQKDIEKTNPGRPWRLLLLNRAIVATRTHQPDLMEEAFGSLVERLPEDAAGFFSQGMQQMDLLNYPPHVRAVMDRYYRKWSVNRSLH